MVNKDRLVKTFTELVQIDSPSGEEEKIAKELMIRLKKLGGKVKLDSYGNVIANFDGIGKPIMLNAHLDTVEPGRGIRPIVKGDKVVSDGSTILGGDAKAGVSIILEALESLKQDKKKHLPIEVVLTREEETSLAGAKNLDYTKIKSKHGLVFDGDEHVSRIFVASPWHNEIDLIITGRAAHAGVEPEKGLSAIEIGARIISLLKLGRIDFETTANIGLINGGSARNAVPEKMRVKGEIRSRDKNKLKKHVAHFKKVVSEIAKKYKDAKIELLIEEAYQGFKIDSKHKTVKLVSETLKSISFGPSLIATGGGSDANIFYKHGVEVVIVGTGVYDAHTVREYVLIDQMFDGAKFCEKLISV